MIIELIQKLPNYIEYKGFSLKLEIFKNGSKEVRISYTLVDYIGKNKNKRKEFKDFNCWRNPISKNICNFLLLYENIQSDEDLEKALKDMRIQLVKLKII